MNLTMLGYFLVIRFDFRLEDRRVPLIMVDHRRPDANVLKLKSPYFHGSIVSLLRIYLCQPPKWHFSGSWRPGGHEFTLGGLRPGSGKLQ
jgi:hypothetical protein